MTFALNLIDRPDEYRSHCFGINDGVNVRSVAVYIAVIGSVFNIHALSHRYYSGSRSFCTVGIYFDVGLMKDRLYVNTARSTCDTGEISQSGFKHILSTEIAHCLIHQELKIGFELGHSGMNLIFSGPAADKSFIIL